jgi:uncharacterized damage-inducible protein DinB
MTDNILEKSFEHNTWANLQIIKACAALSDAQLDSEPQSATKGSIRQTLVHLVDSERDYLSFFKGSEPWSGWQITPSFTELEQVACFAGEGFAALAREYSTNLPQDQIHLDDGYTMDPWVVMVQAINHATEHREQIKSMLSALGVSPPRIDGWKYGRVTNALIPPTAEEKHQ